MTRQRLSSAEARHTEVVFVCGNLGDDACGCGSSEARFAASLPEPVRAVDPTDGFRRGVADLILARTGASPVMIVYPSRAVVKNPRAIALLVLAIAVIPRARRVVHFHEFVVYHELRWPWYIALALFGGRVVVSRHNDAEALRSGLGGLLAKRTEIHIIPPVNGTPAPAGFRVPAHRQPPVTAGLFGLWRAERGQDLLFRLVRQLPASVTRLDAVGSGWDTVPWPADILDRFTIEMPGRVRTEDLPARFAKWDVALALMANGAHDGRMSLRTPLAFGVPTVTTVDDPRDLTLRPPHLVIYSDRPEWELGAVSDDDCRQGAREVRAFEDRCIADLTALLETSRAPATRQTLRPAPHGS